jgi:hypothetical protein
VLAERLGKDWQARKASAPIDAVMRFSDKGLVFGAGTVLAPAGDSGRDISILGSEPRLLALLAAAHLRTPSHVALTHLRKAAESWNRGEDALAAVHLTLSRLDRLARPDADAHRLFLADNLLREGIEADVIVKGLGLGDKAADALERYSPDQPRVPAGSGRSSGEWTSSGGAPAQAAPPKGRPKPAKPPGRTAPPVRPPRPKTPATAASAGGHRASAAASAGASISTAPIPSPKPALAGAAAASAATTIGRPAALDLGRLSPGAASKLAGFLAAIPEVAGLSAGLVGVAVVGGFGLSLIPFPEATGKWIDVGGPGDVSYFKSLYVPAITFRYTDANGVRQEVTGVPGPDGNYRGPDGKVLARIVKTGAQVGLIVATATLTGSQTEGRQICPDPTKDRGGPLGREYEDYMKARFNPGNPTPPGMAYAFPIASKPDPVMIDDCNQKTGDLAEYKGPNYERQYLSQNGPWRGMLSKMLLQAQNQIAAKGDASLTWYFAEKPVADYIRGVFAARGYPIDVEWAPFKKEGAQ